MDNSYTDIYLLEFIYFLNWEGLYPNMTPSLHQIWAEILGVSDIIQWQIYNYIRCVKVCILRFEGGVLGQFDVSCLMFDFDFLIFNFYPEGVGFFLIRLSRWPGLWIYQMALLVD